MNIPEALEALRAARTEDAARAAYWQIDNRAIVQGRMLEAALPTAAVAVTLLPVTASNFAREHLLELLEQLARGYPDAGESADLEDLVRTEVSKGFPSYAVLLQYGTAREALFSVNLVGLCGTQQPALREQARFYLQQCKRHRQLSEGAHDLTEWLAELEEGAR